MSSIVTYSSADVYIESASTLKEKIAKIDAIIVALEATALKAAAGDDISSYMLDDGHTKINTMYRGVDSVMKSIESFEKLKQMYINRLNGRMVRLVDGKNFKGPRNGR